MENWLQKLVMQQNELNENIMELDAFRNALEFEALTQDQRALVDGQYGAMTANVAIVEALIGTLVTISKDDDG